ncbi:hypothetical protein GDO86_011455 [Hymenochirus boettgeri]|uniref:Core Histone H2A/H2B/H3 domain-containing protein n=1 Tax=Hymenochirus boettgeri TaxID=247094 RepID=A0A8T2JGF1_9PIPI|nr:hypothetical protein GDO86_011455 [Hymenochirus boettgeri]
MVLRRQRNLKLFTVALSFFAISITTFFMNYTQNSGSTVLSKFSEHFRRFMMNSKRPCGCETCVADPEISSWFDERFNISISPLLTKQNNVIPESVYKWWLAQKKDGKKRKKSRKESYVIYVYKVLKHVHPDTGFSSKAMGIMNSFVNDIFERIAGEASRLAHYNKRSHLQGDSNRGPPAAAWRAGRDQVHQCQPCTYQKQQQPWLRSGNVPVFSLSLCSGSTIIAVKVDTLPGRAVIEDN